MGSKPPALRFARLLRANAGGGLATAAAVFVVIEVLDLASPLDPLRDPISELAYGWAGPIIRLAFVVAGLGIMALGVALGDAVRSPRPSWPQTTLLLQGGAGIVLLGAFRTDAYRAAVTPAGAVHTAATIFGILSVCAGMLVASLRMRDDSEWYRPNRILWPLAWVGSGLLVVTAVDAAYGQITHDPWRGLVGAVERLLMASLMVWTLCATFHLGRVVPVAR